MDSRYVEIVNEFMLKEVDALRLMKQSSFTLMAVDPGHTTGISIWKVTPFTGEAKMVETIEMLWEQRHVLALELLQTYMPNVLVLESYRLRGDLAAAQIGSTIDAVKMAGIFEGLYLSVALREGLEFPVLVYQRPGEENSVKIARIDYKMVRGSEHRGDAYKHAKLCIAKIFKYAKVQLKLDETMP